LKKDTVNVAANKKELPAQIEAKPEDEPEDGKDAEYQQFLKSAPSQVRGFLMQMTHRSGGPFPHPLFEKFKSEHVGQFLEITREENMREYSLASRAQVFRLVFAALIVAFLVFLVLFLAPSNKDILTDILKILAVFAGGFGAGFGTRSFMQKER